MGRGTVFVINGVTVDVRNEMLCDRSGNLIALRPQCFKVLLHFVEHANRLVTKNELTAAIWPDTAVTDDSLVQCIHEIRRALDDERHSVLKTVLKRGYRLVLPFEIDVEAGAREQSAHSRHRTLRRLASIAAGTLVLLVAVNAAWRQHAGPMMPETLHNDGPGIAVIAEKPSNGETATAEIGTASPQAQDALLLGLEYLHRDTEADTLTAISMFEQAVKLDPSYGRAHAAIAAAQLRILLSPWYTMAGIGQNRTYGSFHVHLAKAMEQPTALSYAVSATRALQTGRPGDGFVFIDKAIALAPHDPDVLVTRATLFNAAGRTSKAETDLRMAMLFDPYFSPVTLRILSMALFNQGKYLEAADTVERLVAQGAATRSDYFTLVSSLGQLGHTDRLTEAIGRYNGLALSAGWEPMSVQEAQWYWNGELFGYHRPYIERLVEGLRKAGVPDGAGMDVPFSRFAALVKQRYDGALDVKGATVIGAARAGGLYDRGVRFVDVRTPAAFARSHIPGAINLPLISRLSKEELAKVATSDDEIVFYCQSKNCGYSAIAAAKAIVWGYTRVYRLDGGLPDWKDADCPIEVASMQ